jgi:predicted RNA polymerase sigma factor
MKHFTSPRADAANLIAFIRARAIDRMRRQADGAASLQRGLDRDNARRNRINQADTTATTASFWILHAR